MRWLILIIIALLLLWRLTPEPEPVAIEDSFIAAPVQKLEDAKNYEQDYLDAVEARNKAAEAAVDGDGN
jgi:hypothetical protein